jgi:hypothetical protein
LRLAMRTTRTLESSDEDARDQLRAGSLSAAGDQSTERFALRGSTTTEGVLRSATKTERTLV